MQIPLPDSEACGAILKDCLDGLGRTFPAIGKLTTSPHFKRCAAACVGLDGRAIRKMVANALAGSPETAMNPNQVSIDQLLAAAQAAATVRIQGGKPK
jgi:hypothetical protein